MSINTINSYDSDENKITLKDLSENGEEKLADLSDDELQELKRQALEVEDYDACKLIKQEQTKRAEKVQEDEDLQELEEQTKREELGGIPEGFQKEREQAKEEAMAKVDELKAQYYDNQDIIEDDDRQTRREEARKTVNTEETAKTNNEHNESNVENKLNEISDEEILSTIDTVTDIGKWRWRENYHMRKKMGDYLTKEDIPGIRKWMKEHPEDGIIDKESFYKKYIDEISEFVKASVRDFSGALIGDTESIGRIITGLELMAKNMKGAGMGESEQFGKLKKIYTYFNNEKDAIEGHNSYDLNIHNVRYRRRA